MFRRFAAIPAFFKHAVLVCLAAGAFGGGAGAAAPQKGEKDIDQQRTRFREAYTLAERGPDDRWRARAEGLEPYPLYPYLEQAAFLRDLAHVDRDALAAFLERHGDAPFARTLRRAALKQLASDARWTEFLSLYQHDEDLALRCAEVAARSAQNASDPELPERMRGILSVGKPLPPECDATERSARAAGLLTAELQWQRIDRAADGRRFAEMRELAADLPEDQRAEALRYATLLADPKTRLGEAAAWTDTARARLMIARALQRLSAQDSALAGKTWLALESHFAWSEAERARAVAGIALDKVSSYAPDAAEWLARVPESGYDQRLAEWRLRLELAERDWPGAQRALVRLDAQNPVDGRVRYWHARLTELSGDRDGARAAYGQLAREPNYFGFLAAERAQLPYTLCPRDGTAPKETLAKVAALPALERAFELRAIGWDTQARREWDYALRTLGTNERVAAVTLAQQQGWNEQGPFTLLRPEEVRYYTLRFPIAHEELIASAAERKALEPALVLGVIRTESAWAEGAVSSAKARGLMQVLPPVAAQLAKREKIKYAGAASLDRPDLNVALGTSHLSDVIGHYQGRTWVALAAYNAGPAPVSRWLAARGSLPPDLWVETVPYKETREYVERVLAFAAIYGWRRDGKALALPAPLAELADDQRPASPYRDVICPVPLAETP
jgi:soluble lytic murein transglycosylase